MRGKKITWCLFTILCTLMVTMFGGSIYADSINEEPTQEKDVNVHDHDSFVKAHKDEFYDYNDDYADDMEQHEIILWDYPFSDKINGRIKECYGNLDFKYLYLDDDASQYLWGYVECSDASKGWICLIDPSNEGLKDVKVDIGQKKSGTNLVIIVLILVFILIVVTFLLISLFWKKKKN